MVPFASYVSRGFFSLVLTALLSRIYDDTKRAKKMFLALIGLLPTNHITAYITMALTKVFENTLINVKSLLKKWQPWRISGRFHTLIWRLREKRFKNWTPRLSRRGDGTVSGTSSSANIFIKVKVHLKWRQVRAQGRTQGIWNCSLISNTHACACVCAYLSSVTARLLSLCAYLILVSLVETRIFSIERFSHWFLLYFYPSYR